MTSLGTSIMDTVVEYLYPNPADGTGGQDGSDRVDLKEVGDRHESSWQLVVDKTENASPDFDEHRPTRRACSHYESEIKQLKEALEASDKQKKEQSLFASKLNRKKTRLENEVKDRDKIIASIRQEARGCELKLEAEISKLQRRLSGEAKSDDTEQKLRDHLKEQSKAIFDLRQILDMISASSDESSPESMLQEVEEERDKLREDFRSAREEIQRLNRRMEGLSHELQSYTIEAMKPSEVQMLENCNNPACKTARAELIKITDEREVDRMRVASLKSLVESQKRRIVELEHAKDEVIDKLAIAMAEAGTYEKDFQDERKDREKARGALEELRVEKEEQDKLFCEEMASLQKQISRLNKERDESIAGFQIELESKKMVIHSLRKQIVKIGHERDDFKNEVKRRIVSKHHKIKDYDRMKEQHERSVSATVDLTNQLDKAKRREKELLKTVMKMEEKNRRFEKKHDKVLGSPTSQSEPSNKTSSAERQSQEEQDSMQSLRIEKENLWDDIEHQKNVITALKKIIGYDQMEGVAPSPAVSEKSLVSPTAEQKAIADGTNDPFKDDPNYVHSEDMGVEEQLKIGYPNPFKANTRHLQKQGRKEESGLVPEAPKGQVLSCGAGPEEPGLDPKLQVMHHGAPRMAHPDLDIQRLQENKHGLLEEKVSNLRGVLQSMTTLTPASSTLKRVLQSLEETSKFQVSGAEVADVVSAEALQQDLSTSRSALQASMLKVRMFEEEVSEKAGEIANLKQQLLHMKMDFVEFGSRNISLGEGNTKALGIIAQLKLYLGEANDERMKWEKATMEAEHKVDLLNEELSSSKELGHKTEEKLNSTKAEIKKLELTVNRLLQDTTRLESQNELLRERLQSRPAPTFQAVERAEIVISGVLDGGAWGTVSAGEYRGCKVAIKQPHQWIMHESTVDRMKREASNMAKMHHPNLVTFIGANFEEDKLPIIVIEMMEANLRVTYKKTSLTKDQMVSIFMDIAYALHHLHEFREPIIHRDLSAPNVLLKSLPGNRFVAKVSDFGSANYEKQATTDAEGAIIYSAPESFPTLTLPKAKQTVKMDTYSFGILMCEVINCKLPDSDHLEEMLKATGDWHSLVLRCIKHDPKERPTMTDILSYNLQV